MSYSTWMDCCWVSKIFLFLSFFLFLHLFLFVCPADTEKFYTVVSQDIASKYGKVFDWTVKAKVMGKPALAAATVFVNELQIPQTPQVHFNLSPSSFLSFSFPFNLTFSMYAGTSDREGSNARSSVPNRRSLARQVIFLRILT